MYAVKGVLSPTRVTGEPEVMGKELGTIRTGKGSRNQDERGLIRLKFDN